MSAVSARPSVNAPTADCVGRSKFLAGCPVRLCVFLSGCDPRPYPVTGMPAPTSACPRRSPPWPIPQAGGDLRPCWMGRTHGPPDRRPGRQIQPFPRPTDPRSGSGCSRRYAVATSSLIRRSPRRQRRETPGLGQAGGSGCSADARSASTAESTSSRYSVAVRQTVRWLRPRSRTVAQHPSAGGGRCCSRPMTWLQRSLVCVALRSPRPTGARPSQAA